METALPAYQCRFWLEYVGTSQTVTVHVVGRDQSMVLFSGFSNDPDLVHLKVYQEQGADEITLTINNKIVMPPMQPERLSVRWTGYQAMTWE